jgi:hypothetical protein
VNQYNLNWLLGLPKLNDYLDIVVSAWDIYLVVLGVYLLYTTLKSKLTLTWDSPKNITIVGCILCYILWQVFTLDSITQLWHFGIVGLRLATWIYCIYQSRAQKLLWSVIGIFSLFDHFLISQSLPVLLIWSTITLLKKTSPRTDVFIKIFCGYIVLNVFASVIQIISGRSVGLSLLGESTLSLQTVGGIAKQTLFDGTFLRGYGLLPHPNMTGFLGVIGLFIGTNVYTKMIHTAYTAHLAQTKTTKDPDYTILLVASGLLVLLSFSRAAWICGLVVIFTTYLYRKKNGFRILENGFTIRSGLVFFSVFLIITGIFMVFYSRISSDIYRDIDLQNWLRAYSKTNLIDRLFGVGFGQYPLYIQNTSPQLPSWQWQPVHNVWLNLIVEIGVVPVIIGLLAIVNKLIRRIKFIK